MLLDFKEIGELQMVEFSVKSVKSYLKE